MRTRERCRHRRHLMGDEQTYAVEINTIYSNIYLIGGNTKRSEHM